MHVGGDARIERTERLIEQQDLRLADHGLRDRQALLHAAGELRRVTCRAPCASPIDSSRPRRVARRAPRSAEQLPTSLERCELEAEQQVLDHREMREQRVALEHDAAIRVRLRPDRLAVDQQLAARRLLDAEQHRRNVVLPQPDAPTIVTNS